MSTDVGVGVSARDLRVLVVTVSTRAAAGVYEDRSGPILAAGVREFGAAVDGPRVVSDGAAVEVALRAGAAAGYDVIITTGGTGFTPDDRTPEMTRRVLDLEIPGIAEALRAAGVAGGVPTALFSRGLAGLAGSTFVVNLPGSTGAVRDGLGVLLPLLTEIVRHARGGSH
jgi:molybdenum cofactor synthesis domain-containing protein